MDGLLDFINVVERQIGKKISEQDAEELILAAEAIIIALDQS